MNGLPPDFAASGYGAAAGNGDPYAHLRPQQQQGQHPPAGFEGHGHGQGHQSSSSGLLSPREEELLRLHDAHNRIVEAEMAARAMRDRVLAQQAAQAALRGSLDGASFHGGGFQGGGFQGGGLQGISPGLQDEALRSDGIEGILAAQQAAAAARHQQHQQHGGFHGQSAALDDLERLQRQRLLEEELAAKQRQQWQQAQAAVTGGGYHHQVGGGGGFGDPNHPELGRLLQLSQLSDEDLIRRAAEVRGAQGNTLAALDHQLFEARMLQQQQQQQGGGGGGMAQGQGGGLPRFQAADGEEAGPGHPPHPHPLSQGTNGAPSHQQPPQPLRYFNNGVEVDVHGRPLPAPTQLAPSAAQGSNSPPLIHGVARPPPPPPGAGGAEDANIVAKFLTVVVSRVPEVAGAVADLLPDPADAPTMAWKDEFPRVVEATLRELHSLGERSRQQSQRFAGGGGDGGELAHRVENCIRAIEPYKVDLGQGGGAAGAGMGGQLQPSLDPNNYGEFGSQQLPAAVHVPGANMGMTGTTMSGMPQPPQAYLAAQQHQAAQQGYFADALASLRRAGGAPPKPSARDSDSDDDELPMMAAHKAHKRAAKRAPTKKGKKKKTKGGKGKKRKRRKKKNTEPKVVWRGALDGMEHGIEGGVVRLENEGTGRGGAENPGKTEEGKREKTADAPTEEAVEASPARPAADAAATDAAAAADAEREKSRPMKKRRISDEDAAVLAEAVDAVEGEAAPPPEGRAGMEGDAGSDVGKEDGGGAKVDGSDAAEGKSKSGPHGELLDRLFGGTKEERASTLTEEEEASTPMDEEKKEIDGAAEEESAQSASEPSDEKKGGDEAVEGEASKPMDEEKKGGDEAPEEEANPSLEDEAVQDAVAEANEMAATPAAEVIADTVPAETIAEAHLPAANEEDTEVAETDEIAAEAVTEAEGGDEAGEGKDSTDQEGAPEPTAAEDKEADVNGEGKEEAKSSAALDLPAGEGEEEEERPPPAALSTIESIRCMLAPKPSNGTKEGASEEEKEGDGKSKEEESKPSAMDLLQGYSTDSSVGQGEDAKKENDAPKPAGEKKEGSGAAKEESQPAAEPSVGEDAKEDNAESNDKPSDADGKAEANAAAAEEKPADGAPRTTPESTLITDDSDHERKPASQPASPRPRTDDAPQPANTSDSQTADKDGCQTAGTDQSKPAEEPKEGEGEGGTKRRPSDYGAADVLLGLMGK